VGSAIAPPEVLRALPSCALFLTSLKGERPPRHRLSLCESRHKRFKRRLLDHRQRVGWRDPLNHALLELGPELALSCHEQGKDLDLASDANAISIEELLVGEKAERFRTDFSSDPSFLEGLACCRSRRPQAFDRPAFRNDQRRV